MPMDDYSKKMAKISIDELLAEREIVKHLLG